MFASLSALIFQHTLTPLALPSRLVLPQVFTIKLSGIQYKLYGIMLYVIWYLEFLAKGKASSTGTSAGIHNQIRFLVSGIYYKVYCIMYTLSGKSTQLLRLTWAQLGSVQNLLPAPRSILSLSRFTILDENIASL